MINADKDYMKNKYFIFWFLIFTVQPKLFGAELDLETWRFGKVVTTLAKYGKKKLLISKQCINPKNPLALRSNCKKLLDIISFSNKKIPFEVGGKNPGSVICKKRLNGKVRFAKNLDGEVRTFCEMKKKIIIDNLWILRNYGKHN